MKSPEKKSGEEWEKPVKGIVTSLFGERENPIFGKEERHNGIDIAVKEGTEVKACIDGIVTKAGEEKGYGNVIRFKNDEYEILYAHLKSIGKEAGDAVKKGEIVALSGNTGYSTGPHLHFTVIKNGREVDPFELYEGGSSYFEKN